MLSRNKTIKLLHRLTNDSYKKCRAELKANNWNINRVLYPEFYALSDSVTAILEGLEQFSNAVAEAVNSAFMPIVNALKEALDNA
jgi:hypothetical protein